MYESRVLPGRSRRRGGYRARMTEIARPDELRALNRLTFKELAGAVGGIGGLHRGVAERGFGLVGPMSGPARLGHDLITTGVYRSVSASAEVVGRGADRALGRRSVRDGRMVSKNP